MESGKRADLTPGTMAQTHSGESFSFCLCQTPLDGFFSPLGRLAIPHSPTSGEASELLNSLGWFHF